MTYAPIATNRLGRPASGSGLLLPLRQLFEYAGRLVKARRGRRDIARLARAESATLADIGIARADVAWALAQPWDCDPSLARKMPERSRTRGTEILVQA